MNKRYFLILPFCLLCLIIGWIVFLANPALSPEPIDDVVEKSQKGRSAQSQTSPITPEDDALDIAAKRSAVPSKESQPEAAFVKKNISSEWTDAPGKLAGRQRVRIVEADFKYPFPPLGRSCHHQPADG